MKSTTPLPKARNTTLNLTVTFRTATPTHVRTKQRSQTEPKEKNLQPKIDLKLPRETRYNIKLL